MYKKEKLGTLLILAVFVAFFIMTGDVNPKCQTYPYFVFGVGTFLTALHLGIVIYKEKHNIAIEVSASLTKQQFLSMAITVIGTFFYVLLAKIVGYFTMTFIYVIIFSYWHSRDQKKWMYFAVSGGMCVVIYFAFKVFLHVPLPSGFLI